MNYVEHCDVFGVEFDPIPCNKGNGPPTTSTEGAIGCLYMNTASITKDVYKCVGATDGVYTWIRIDNVAISEIDEMRALFDNGIEYVQDQINDVLRTEQSLTEKEQEIARKNIGALSAADIEITNWNQCEGKLHIGLLSYDGTIRDQYVQWATRIVEVEERSLYRITACVSEATHMVQFQDDSGNVIKRIIAERPADGIYQKHSNFVVEVPPNAATIHVCSIFDVQMDAYRDIETYPIIEKGTPINAIDVVKYLMDKDESESNYSPLLDKVIVNFGDSIFGGFGSPEDISTEIARLTGATVHNCGFGGCRMAKHFMTNYSAFSMYELADAVASGDWSEQDHAITDTTQLEKVPAYFANTLEILKGLDFSNVDIVTIAYGTNDFTGGVDVENTDNAYDTNTFTGALRYSIETLLTAYPHLKIFVCSPIYRFWMDANYSFIYDSDTYDRGNGVKLTDFVSKTEEIAHTYHLSFIDNYDIGMNKFNRSQYFTATDGTHPNITGRHLIAAHIAKELF